MRNFTLGLIVGLILGGSAWAFLNDDDDLKRRPSYEERMDRIDDYWFLRGFNSGLNTFDKSERNPC